MPVPIIAAGAAAIAARLAAKKVAQEVAKKTAKAAAAKTTQIAKNSVKVKPARKPVGNPPNDTKMWEDYIGSVSRGAPGRGPAGKAKASRIVNSRTIKKSAPIAKEPARIPEIPSGRSTVKINTDPTKFKGIFGPLKKKAAAADTPANRAKATNNARGLKAANKPVSKNNRNRFGDGEMSAYLKSTKPARANRTRLGNTAKKSK